MSSHHIVRDAQEPALIVAGHFPFEQVGSLLEWSPVVVVLYDYLEEVLSWEVKIDALVLPLALAPEASLRLAHQLPVNFIFEPHNSQALKKALTYLHANDHKTISIIGKTPQETNTLPELEKEVIFYHEDYKIFCPKAGFFKKWVEKGSIFKIWGEGDLNTQNLNKQKHSQVYTAQESGFVEISLAGQAFWLAEKVW